MLTSPGISPLSSLDSYTIIPGILFSSMVTFTVFPISLDHMLFSTVSKLYAFPTLARYWEGDLASVLYFRKLTSCWSSTVFISFSCCSFFGIKTQNYSFSSASYIASYLHISISFLNSTRLLLFGAYVFSHKHFLSV